MIVINQLEAVDGIAGAAVALGTFDGVHLGHQRVIGRAAACAKRTGAKSVVVTFGNHPLSILTPGHCPLLITAAAEKERLMAELQIDVLCRIPFTGDLLRLAPRVFIDRLLSVFLPAAIIVGPNYSFGYRGLGTPELLTEIGREKGFSVHVQEAVDVDGSMVSSTSIRHYIGSGDVSQAAKLLGRPFRLAGKVVDGDKRGRTLGFPTANIALPPEQLLPGDGVYAVYALIDGQRLPALANIGSNPTFLQQTRRLEVFILDFQSDLYGIELGVEFSRRLRSELTFTSVEALTERIALDVAEARAYFDGR
ncbi:MAG: bifunctional riboflavin kinase/FAD synthetase [Sporomusaceae bacterium]|nr:bifunctional riboflavin kinase/FAD synthetase [Sporomusaceae bacterium]